MISAKGPDLPHLHEVDVSGDHLSARNEHGHVQRDLLAEVPRELVVDRGHVEDHLLTHR